MSISSVLPYIQLVISVLLIAAVLLQQTGAQNGGALGGGGDSGASVFHTRRGLEKTLFITTIVLGILFALTAFVSLLR